MEVTELMMKTPGVLLLALFPRGRVAARGQGWAGWDFEPCECGEPSLLFPEALSHPGACLQLCPRQAWGYLLEWTLSVPLGASRTLNTVVLIPEALVLVHAKDP